LDLSLLSYENREFLYRYYPLIVRYRRSIAASLAGIGTLVALTLVVPGPGPQTKILVAAQPLAAGTTLTASDIEEKFISDKSSWDTLQSEPIELVGRVLARSLAPNQPISSNDLVGSALLTGLPKNYVAASLPVSASTSSSLLNVGNFIDVYGASNDGLNSGVLIASRARILAIPNQAGGSMFSSASTNNSIIVGVDSVAAISIAGNVSNQGFTIALLP
jgi:Flp pilus assembly protein CpaB